MARQWRFSKRRRNADETVRSWINDPGFQYDPGPRPSLLLELTAGAGKRSETGPILFPRGDVIRSSFRTGGFKVSE